MKLKVSEWGDSHGLRITSAIMEHLNIQSGDEVDVSLTENGIELIRRGSPLGGFDSIKRNNLNALLLQSNPVSNVDDPYSESDVDYIVIDINPCSPVIREVPKGTSPAYATLAEAKEAARQVIQSAIEEAQNSLPELRQVGIDKIVYITL